MSKLRDIIEQHGGSFHGAPNKASFYLPIETNDGAVSDALRHAGCESQIRFMKTAHDGWRLFRFVGSRKDYKTIRVNDRLTDHGINPNLVIRIWKDGTMEIAEKGRRSGFSTSVGKVYYKLLLNDAFKKVAEKHRAKIKRKKDRSR